MTKKLHNAFIKQKQAKESVKFKIYGTLGIPLGGHQVVEVPNRAQFVYVRLRTNQSEVVQAFNNTVAPSYGLPVIVIRDGNRYVIQDVDTVRYNNNWNNSAPFLPTHGTTHSFNDNGGGGDMVWVYSKQFMPMLVYPTGTYGGSSVFISPHMMLDSYNNWHYVGNTGTPNILQYVPSGTQALMALIYMDRNTGNPGLLINSGSLFSNQLSASSDIAPYIPSPTINQIPLAAIKVSTGTSTITWDYIYDVRQFNQFRTTGSSGGGGGGGGSSTFGFAGLYNGIPLGTGSFLNVHGNNVNFTLSGSTFDLNVGAGSGSTTIWNNGIPVGTPSVLDLGNNLYANISGNVAEIDALPGVYDVIHYGADKTGLTDSTSAINRTIAAMPNSGGVLYFPPGTYLTSGSHSISKYTTIRGGGSSAFSSTGTISAVYCTSSSNNLFTITADYARIENIFFKNTASSTPTAGAAISTQGSYLAQKVDFENVNIYGFYIDADIQVGAQWYMHGCLIQAPVQYGVKIRNTVNGDAGDWSISDSFFNAEKYNSSSAIRVESSGGGKISNIKINSSPEGHFFTNGLDLQPTALTTILLISNSSIENILGNGINIVTSGISYNYINIIGNQFGLYGNSTGNAIKISASSLGEVANVNIAHNIFAAGTAPYAISLTNVSSARIDDNRNVSFGALVSQTTCSGISIDTSVQDEGIFKGYVDTFNFVGAGVTATVSGTVANINIPNAGGGTSFTGIPVYKDGTFVATGTSIDFEKNLYVGATGSTIYVNNPVTTYFRVGQPTTLSGPSGTFWIVPDAVYASGSLGVFLNGHALIPGLDYIEQLYVSGTYQYLFAPPTGTYHLAHYGVPCYPQTQISTGTGITDSNSITIVDNNGTVIVDSNGS